MRRTPLLPLLLSLVLAWPTGAGAQGGGAAAAEKAKRHYQKGSEAYSVGRYEEAIKELEEAYRLSGESILLYNIAKSYEKLGKWEEGARHFRDYLDLTPTIPEADRAEVERSIKELERKRLESLPELTIRSTPEGAKVFIDEKTKIAGQTPMKARLEPGTHKLYIEKKGFEPLEKTLEMRPGQPLVLDFELRPVEEFGEVQVVADVDGARIFLDGKNIGISPFRETAKVKVGKHQVILEKQGFYRYLVTVEVPKGRIALVNANLRELESQSEAPATLGWTGVIVGSFSLIGAYVAGAWANGLVPWTPRAPFDDTDEYHLLAQTELWSYVAGGSLWGIGLTLLIYDGVREPPDPNAPPPVEARTLRSIAPLVLTW